MISRFKPPVWIVTPGAQPEVFRSLLFSYGVLPVAEEPAHGDWRAFAGRWLKSHGLPGERIMLVAGPSPSHPDDNHRIEFMSLSKSG
jgi:pyruvate kinase